MDKNAEAGKHQPRVMEFFVEEIKLGWPFLKKMFLAFFMPGRLSGLIDFNDSGSFNEAMKFALKAFGLFAVLESAFALFLKKKFDSVFAGEMLIEYSFAVLLLFAPAGYVFAIQRLIKLKNIPYGNYCHCYAYFAGALILGWQIFTILQVVITRVAFGSPGDWPMHDKSAPICSDPEQVGCSISNAFHRGAAGLKAVRAHQGQHWVDLAYAANVGLLLVILFCSFRCHLSVIQKKLEVSKTYLCLVYVSYVFFLNASLLFIFLLAKQFA